MFQDDSEGDDFDPAAGGVDGDIEVEDGGEDDDEDDDEDAEDDDEEDDEGEEGEEGK